MQILKRTVRFLKLTGGGDAELVNIDLNGRPTSLLGHGYHFVDAESYRHNRTSESTPIDKMIKSVELQQLKRPQY